MSGYGLTLKTEGTRMVSRELTHMAPESKITTSLIVTIKVTVCFDFFHFASDHIMFRHELLNI